MAVMFFKYISCILTLASVYCLNDWVVSGIFAQKFILHLQTIFVSYWTVSIFIFLFKKSLFATTTTIIQRYWKRALYLFWSLEIILFSIYFYLLLICPTEVEWLLDQPQLFNSDYIQVKLYLSELIPPFILIALMDRIKITLNIVNFHQLKLMLVIVLLALLSLLLNEVYQSINYLRVFDNLGWEFDTEVNHWELTSAVLKIRVYKQYLTLITLLKYWHIVFIYIFYQISLSFTLDSIYISQGIFSSNKQNFIFLFLFSGLWFLWAIKPYLVVLYKYIYYWFFINRRSQNYELFSSWGFILRSLLPLY